MKDNFEKKISRLIVVVLAGLFLVGSFIIYRGIQIEAMSNNNDSLSGGDNTRIRMVEVEGRTGSEDVPDFTGKLLDEFEDWAIDNEVIYAIEYEYSDDIVVNLVITQRKNKENGIVVLVSRGIDYSVEVVLPNFVGMTVEQIQEFVKKNHLSGVTYNYITDDNTMAGKYLSTDTNKNKIKRSEKIVITISLGKKEEVTTKDNRVVVIDFSKMTKNEIDNWGVSHRINIVYSSSHSNSVSKGSVISQSVAKGVRLDPNATIVITLSLGKQIIISDYSNKPYSEFVYWRNAQDGQLVVSRANEFHNSIAKDYVISNSPKSGVLNDGDSVSIIVSLGRPSVNNYFGKQVVELNNEITSLNHNGAKLSVQVEEEYSNQVVGTVISQDKSGTMDVGSVIVVKVSKGVKPVEPVNIPAFTSEAQAIAWASSNGFSMGTITRQYSNDYANGVVYNQTPVANSSHLPGSVSISLSVSLGKPNIPNLAGMDVATANSSLATINGSGGNITIVVGSEAYSSSYGVGQIISQSKVGVSDVGTVVSVVLSKGAEPLVTVGYYTGMDYGSASSSITGSGLNVSNSDGSCMPSSTVEYQSVESGQQVSSGTVVDLRCSLQQECDSCDNQQVLCDSCGVGYNPNNHKSIQNIIRK